MTAVGPGHIIAAQQAAAEVQDTLTMQPISGSQLLLVLEGIQAGLCSLRPLARVRQQLLGDLAALLTGLRGVLMLDYAPGTHPQQINQLLLPLRDVPGWSGCILELEGCCYVANSTLLLERVSQLAADTASWPVVVSFTGADPHHMQEGAEQQHLQQQLKQLHTVLQQGLGAAGQHACSTAGNNQHTCSTPSGPQGASVEQQNAPEGQSAVQAAGQEWLPLIKLGNCQNLPAMPTLNGFLLGYPVVYHVRDLQEAGVASRMLSASQLQLHRVVATCAAQLTAVLQAAGDQRSNQAAAHQACDKVVLMSFTLPATAESADAQEKVQQTVHRLRGRQVELPDIWQALELSVISVGPQAVSL